MSRAIQCVWAPGTAWQNSPAEVCFSPIAMNYGDDGFASTEEAEANIIIRRATIFSNLSINIQANTLTTAATTVYFRKNGANGNQSIVIPALTSGTFTDSTNSDTLASGDTYCISPSTASGGSGLLTISGANIVVNDTSGASVQFCIASDLNTSVAASTVYYLGPGGIIDNNTILAAAEITIDVAGISSGLSLYVATNARTSNSVFESFKNGAVGNQTITVPAGSTGSFSDVTNTDSISAGDKICTRLSIGTGVGSFGLRNVVSTFVPTSGRKLPLIAQYLPGRVRSGSATVYFPLGGIIVGTTASEADAKIKPRFSGRASYLRVGISANAATATQNLYLRVNGASSALSVTIPSGATGIFSDISNEVVFSATDDLNYMWANGTSGGSTIVYAHILIEDVTSSSQIIFF